MPDTPAWVRDAVFYQIFPDRFASSERVAKPGPLEPWDAPPTNYGFKGGDLLGIVEHLDHLDVARGQRALPDAGLPVGLEPPLPHVRLPRGRPAPRRRRGAARAARRGARARTSGSCSTACSTTPAAGFWPFHHVLETGAGSPYRNWFHFDQAALDAGPSRSNAYPAGRLRTGVAVDEPLPVRRSGTSRPTPAPRPSRLGYEAWWGIPALPKLNVAEPAVREYLWGVAEHWLRFGIDGWRLDVPAEIDDPRVLGRVPAPLPRGQPRGVPRRRDLARRARSGSPATASTP